jgi:hypothetical protein
MKCSASILFMRFRAYILLLAIPFFVFAVPVEMVVEHDQQTQNVLPTDTVDTLMAGKVVVIQGQSITKLVKAHIAYNTKLQYVDGFRIQIFSDSGPNAKTDAGNARNNCLSKFSAYEAYLVYKQPSFKIYVGDFKTQLDAKQAMLKLLPEYPGAIIVKDKVAP